MVNHPRRSLKTFIPFEPYGDPGECRAVFEGLQLTIYKATDTGFGYAAIRIEPIAGLRSDLSGPGIHWVRTKRNCIDGLERIVERERALAANRFNPHPLGR